MTNYKPAKISITPGVTNSLILNEDQADKSSAALYQLAFGAFMRPAMHSCPDLAYSVEVLSRFCSNPGLAHIELVKHVLQYVSGTLHLGLKFDREADTLDDVVRYTDSDYTSS